MDSKCWAAFFVYLLSSSYVGTAVGQMTQMTCQPNEKMQREIVKYFDNVSNQLAVRTFNLEDDTAGNLQMTGGTMSGLQNCKVKPPLKCQCNKNLVRIFINVSFIDVTVTFVVTLIDDLHGGFLGNLGTSLARLLGQVVNFLVNLLALEFDAEIAVEQRLIPGSTCTITSFKVARISKLRFLNLNLTQLLLGPLLDILTPVVDTLLRQLLERQVREIVEARIQKMRITPDMFTCEEFRSLSAKTRTANL